MSSLFNNHKNQIFKFFSIIYIISTFQIINYIVQKQTNRYGNDYILWFSVIFIILIILLEILLNYNTYIILTEVIILSLLLHALFIPVTGLLGPDAQYDFHLIKLINNYGWSLQLNNQLKAWPALHIFIIISSKITGLSLLDTARYMPSAISVTVFFSMFCLIKYIYSNRHDIALLYILLISIIYYFSFFYSLPVRETFAFVILFVALYSYIIGKEQTNFKMNFFAIFFGLFLIISHHFTVVMYFLFLIILTVSCQVLKNSKMYKFSNYPLMILTASLAYWIFVSFFVFKEIIVSVQNFVSFGEINLLYTSNLIYPPHIDMRAQIFGYSRYITFSMIILIFSFSIIKDKKKLNFYEGVTLIYIILIFIEWFITSYGLVPMTILPERLELFAWVFLLIILCPILVNNFSKNSKIYTKIITVVFLISFIAMNFSLIRPDLYDSSIQPPYENGGVRLTYLPEEYSAADWFNGDGLIQGDRTVEELFKHNISGKIETNPELFNGNLSKIQSNDWLIIRKEMFKRIIGTRSDNSLIKKPLNLSTETYNLLNNYTAIEKIYSNGEVDIYSVFNRNKKV